MRRRRRQDPTHVAAGVDVPPAPIGWRRPRWWVIGFAAVASISVSVLATVAPAERDAYMHSHALVPELVGRTVADAARMMVPLHLGILVLGSLQDSNAPVGVVLRQNPPPGRVLPIGSVIQLRVSQGSGVVPHLRGVPAHEAARRLENIGLRLGRVSSIEDDAPPDTVLEQFTPPGHRLDPNAPVDILVSGGHGDAAARLSPADLLPETPPPAAPSAATPDPDRTSDPAPAQVARPAGSPARPAVRAPRPQPPVPQQPQEGTTSAGTASAVCSGDAERQRSEICHEPANDRRSEPDVQGPEHRRLPAGP